MGEVKTGKVWIMNDEKPCKICPAKTGRSFMSVSRRQFLKGVVPVAGGAVLSMQTAGNNDVLLEPSRSTMVRGSYDVVVAGGGPAGVAAAVSAGRAGAKTLLLESHGCLGGIWTSGLVGCVLDFDKGGLTAEITARLDALGARKRGDRNNFHYEPEYMKYVCEELCREAGFEGFTVFDYTPPTASILGLLFR